MRSESSDHLLNHIVEGTALRDGDERGLVVRGRVDGGNAVGARRETAGNGDGEDTVLALVVETLEEDELGGVERVLRIGGGDGLDDNVRMALDEAGVVDDLRRHVERGVGVREVAKLHVLDEDVDVEVLVRGDRTAVGRVLELRERHLVLGRDHTHRGRVARALNDLLAVRLCLAGELQAEVDEVVRRR